MFPLPFAAPHGVLLYALFALDLLLLTGGLVWGPLSADGAGRLPLSARLSLSGILVGAALVQWRIAGKVAGYAGWICLGMALGFLGDLIMARLIRVPDRLVSGMLAFGAGHIAYVAALLNLTSTLGLPTMINLPLWLGLLVLDVLTWQTLVRKPGGQPRQNAAALVYGLLMATLNALAIGVAIQNARFVPLALGAILFLISDTVLGNWVIQGRFWPRVNDVIWITYNLAQLLIVYSVAAAANALLAA